MTTTEQLLAMNKHDRANVLWELKLKAPTIYDKVTNEILRLVTLASVLLVCGLTGCASVISGPQQKVEVVVSEPKAEVRAYPRDDKDGGWWDHQEILAVRGDKITPLGNPRIHHLSLKRGKGFWQSQSYLLRVTAKGFRTEEYVLRPWVNPWIAGNLVTSGFIVGLAVDGATGSGFQFENPVFFRLQEEK